MEIKPPLDPQPIPYIVTEPEVWSVKEITPIKTVAKPKVYSVDLDNTLSIGSAWTCEDCENLEPRLDVIEKINELAEHNFVVIHTARRHSLYLPTIKWLEKHHVNYQALRFGKMPADIIFDLDAVNRVEDL